MRVPFSFIKSGGAVPAPTLASLNYAQGDIAGGGQSIIATGTNCAGVTLVNIWGGTVVPTATTATTVTFTLPAHALGSTTVSLTSPGGTSGTLAFESWSPVQVTNISAYLDADKGVTGGAAVSAWLAQDAGAKNFTQATGANKPAQVASVFGSLPAIRITTQTQYVQTSDVSVNATGLSCFAVAKWTAGTTGQTFNNSPLTIVGDVNGSTFAFGASAGQIDSRHYGSLGNQVVQRGSGLNTGAAFLIGATFDTTSNAKCYLGATQQGATATDAGGLDGSSVYSSIGSGYNPDNGFIGDLGAVIIVLGVISGGDLTKLNAWAQQRFGT